MKTNELTSIKKQRIMQRAHQIAKCVKKYQQPNARYSILLADSIRKAYREWNESVMREAIQARLQNEQGYSREYAERDVSTMSSYQVNLFYNTMPACYKTKY